MRFALPLIALGSVVSAQNMTQSSADFASGLVAALTAGGFTSLVAAVSQLGPTAAGAKFLDDIQAGPATLLAPTNGALSGLVPEVAGNMTRLAEVLSYHLLNGTYNNDTVAIAPRHTISRTTLTELQYANIPNGQDLGQAIVLYKDNRTNEVQIDAPYRSWNGHPGNISTEMPVLTYQNLTIVPIGQVIALPPTLAEFATQNASAIAGVLTTANLVAPLSALRGATIFLPTDSAVAKLGAEALAMLNESAIATILQNHVINSTVVYSTGLGSASAVSLAGEPFTFGMNGSMATVTSGNVTANIVRSDIIITNGVVHLIDGVLANTMSNQQAAQSAASVAATASMTTDVGVGPTQGSGGGTGTMTGTGGQATMTGTGTLGPFGSASAVTGGGVGSGAAPVNKGAIKGVLAAVVVGAVAMVWV